MLLHRYVGVIIAPFLRYRQLNQQYCVSNHYPRLDMTDLTFGLCLRCLHRSQSNIPLISKHFAPSVSHRSLQTKQFQPLTSLNSLSLQRKTSHSSTPSHEGSLYKLQTQHSRSLAPLNTFHLQRRCLQTQQFQPFAPPNPTSLPKAAPAKQYRRTRKWIRRLIYALVTVGILHEVDKRYYASSITRSTRTFSLGLLVALDYKINFRAHPPLATSIQALHARNAERLANVLRANGGLYLKIGQAIAMQSAVLPPEFQKMFAKMFDDAPQNDWKDVEQVIREDFGKSPEEVFGVSFTGDPSKGLMERTARASASVAQVHWAMLPNGDEVAIKVQKREIDQQVGWDLWAFE